MIVKELLTLEYEHMKEEQRLRIGTRDNLVYATLGSIGLVIAGTIQTHVVEVLLLVPPVCLVLGWTYLVNDDRITAIGRHIEAAIVPGLSALAPDVPVLSWERVHRSDLGRRRRKTWQLAVDLLTFVGSPLAALSVMVLTAGLSVGLLAVAGGELVGVGLLAAQFVGHAARS